MENKGLSTPDTVLMIRPARFGSNPETAASNTFQKDTGTNLEEGGQKARKEFDTAVERLRNNGVQVLIMEDSDNPEKPDAIFPNNWFSTFPDGTLVLYPMLAPSRRLEVRRDLPGYLEEAGFRLNEVIDLTAEAETGRILEGTGSLVPDHVHKIFYASRSPRTSVELASWLADKTGYTGIYFDATDEKQIPVYHTNVVMCIGEQFVIICLDALPRHEERELLKQQFLQNEKEIIAISRHQMGRFAGNMLEVKTRNGRHLLVMSTTAHKSLSEEQLAIIKKNAEPVPLSIPFIEQGGGGSARCMLAGIHLPKQ